MTTCRSKVTNAIRSSEGWIAALDEKGNWVWVEMVNFDRFKERADQCVNRGTPVDHVIDALDHVIRTGEVNWMRCSTPEGVFELTF